MKKIVAYAMPLIGAVGTALADETVTVDVSGVSDVGGAMETAFESAASTLTPIIVAVVCIGVGLWLIPRVVGILKSAFSSGKGR